MYGFLPEYHGSHREPLSQGPVIGGLRAGTVGRDANTQGGRGDNPGLTMWNIRSDNRFTQNWVLRVQWKKIDYNEEFFPYLTDGVNGKPVDDLDMGSEFGSELYYLFNWNSVAMISWVRFDPGTGLEQINEALTGRDDVASASRWAMEYIWRF